MCGLAAIYAYGAGADVVSERELTAIRDAMAARGPDGAGQWIAADRRVGLAHRRLAIIDLSPAGAQPMAFAPAGEGGPRYHITYNGEIYNYRALRAELEAQGARFASQSDTEVILQLYHRHGPAMVERLRGMFAFALWDEARRGLLLARDPFGIKPLYYADDGRTVRVASQVKALLSGGAIARTPSAAGSVGFFLLGSVPEPHTVWRDIAALPAGATLWIDAQGARPPVRYFDATASLAARVNGAAADLSSALAETVEHHLVADVPVGVFLSAGLDSATLAALAADRHRGIETFTLGFDEFRGDPRDEVPLAEAMAREFGTAQRTVRVTGADFRAERERLFTAMDQPTIDGINVYFVAKAARDAGLKVALSGLGGDELFCGYDTFREIPRLTGALGWIPGLGCAGRALRRTLQPIAGRLPSPKWASLFEYGGSDGGVYLLRRGLYLPWELPAVLDPDLVREGLAAFRVEQALGAAVDGIAAGKRRVMALELAFYMRNQLLRDADWAGMAHSLEIRVPLVDAWLFRALLPVLGTDAASKQAMAAAPRRPLPTAVLERPKTGFWIPIREWLLGDDPAEAAERGYRGWAKRVYRELVAAPA